MKDCLALLLVLCTCAHIHYYWTIGTVRIVEELNDFGTTRTHVANHCMFQMATIYQRLNAEDQNFTHTWLVLDLCVFKFMPLLIMCVLLGLYTRAASSAAADVTSRACAAVSQRTIEAVNSTRPVSVGNTTDAATVTTAAACKTPPLNLLDTALTREMARRVYPVLVLTFILCNVAYYVIHTAEQLRPTSLESAWWTLLRCVARQLQHAFLAVKGVIILTRSRTLRGETRMALSRLTSRVARGASTCRGCRGEQQRHQAVTSQQPYSITAV